MKNRFFLNITTENKVVMTLNITEKNIEYLKKQGLIALEQKMELPESTILIYVEKKGGKDVEGSIKNNTTSNNTSNKRVD